MEEKQNSEAAELMRQLEFVDKDTLELKAEIQYKGCPFCEVDDGEFIENHQTRQALFYKFKKCNNCSLIYPYPRPNKQALESYYKTKRYFKKTEQQFNYSDMKVEKERAENGKNSFWRGPIKYIWRRFPLTYTYQEFKRFAKKRFRILDVGAGDGRVARELIKQGCIVEAVEPDSYRAAYLRKRVGIKVYEKGFEEVQLQDSAYDMVIFSQVLMHLFSIKKIMQQANYVLRTGGLFVSSQHNFNSIIQKTLRSPYPGRGLTAFTVCSWFTPESLKKILEKSGFVIVDIMFRPESLLGNSIFVEGYPGRYLTRSLLRFIDQIIKIVLMQTGTTDYFAIIAKKETNIPK